MLAHIPPLVQSGSFAPEIHLPATARMALMDFIRDELLRWRDHPARPPGKSETALTEHLCDHLNSAAYGSETWSHAQFRTETADETHAGRKIDLAVKPRAATFVIENRRHSQFETLFPIECKRLPTPTGRDRDEREYVFTASGTTGGIQRFKFGHHAEAHNFVGMIGFVQEHDYRYWFGKVNAWINGLAAERSSAWRPSEALEGLAPCGEGSVCSMDSIVHRSGRSGICRIRHIWIHMSSPSGVTDEVSASRSGY